MLLWFLCFLSLHKRLNFSQKTKLRQNAVPSYFPWTEEVQINDQKEDLFGEHVSNIEIDNIREHVLSLLSFNVIDILDKKIQSFTKLKHVKVYI